MERNRVVAEPVPFADPVPAAEPATAPTAYAGASSATEQVVCPECGATAVVTLNRRESADFCRTCDYPLFWTPANVLRSASDGSAEDTLRRLPGTVGRATVASQPCPHCAEPNALSAQVCIRCGRPMHLEERPAPPPPPPAYVPPPPEPVYVVPKRRIAWWVWALLALGVVATVVLIVLAVTGVIG
jgi:hypothetical protein